MNRQRFTARSATRDRNHGAIQEWVFSGFLSSIRNLCREKNPYPLTLTVWTPNEDDWFPI